MEKTTTPEKQTELEVLKEFLSQIKSPLLGHTEFSAISAWVSDNPSPYGDSPDDPDTRVCSADSVEEPDGKILILTTPEKLSPNILGELANILGYGLHYAHHAEYGGIDIREYLTLPEDEKTEFPNCWHYKALKYMGASRSTEGQLIYKYQIEVGLCYCS